jgi:hypothetical protein
MVGVSRSRDRRLPGPICGLRISNSTLPQLTTAGFMLVLNFHSVLPGLEKGQVQAFIAKLVRHRTGVSKTG